MLILYLHLMLILSFPVPQAEGQDNPEGEPAYDISIRATGSVIMNHESFKGILEKPFHIEAVYEVTPCDKKLASIEVRNAHYPLTWYEIDEEGKPVNVMFNPKLNYFNDHTTYVVMDMSQHTDTVYIDFDRSIRLLNVYPNPHRGILWIEYSAFGTTEIDLQVMDCSGRLVNGNEQVLAAGENRLTLDMDQLGQGIYFLRMKGPCIDELIRIIHLE